MKLLLASATSLIALLTFETRSASAAPFSLLKYNDLVADVHPGASVPYTFGPMAIGITTVTVAGALDMGGFIRDRVASLLATPHAIAGNSNPNGTITSSLATGVTFLDRDPVTVDAADPGTSTLAYTYIPVSYPSVSSGPPNDAAVAARSDGNDAGAEDAPIVVTTLSAAGVASDYASLFNYTMPIPTVASTISLGTLGLRSALSGYMTLKNAMPDANRDPWTLIDLTSKGTSFGADDPCVFTVSVPSGTMTAQADTASLDILVTGKGVGREDTVLTVYTDDSVAYGGAGDSFAYVMTAAVPEPMAIATIGSSLGGLAFMRRRAKNRAKAR